MKNAIFERSLLPTKASQLYDLGFGYMGVSRRQEHGYRNKKIKRCTLDVPHVDFSENRKFIPKP